MKVVIARRIEEPQEIYINGPNVFTNGHAEEAPALLVVDSVRKKYVDIAAVIVHCLSGLFHICDGQSQRIHSTSLSLRLWALGPGQAKSVLFRAYCYVFWPFPGLFDWAFFFL